MSRLTDEKEWYLSLFLVMIVLSALFVMSVNKISIWGEEEVDYNAENKIVNLSKWTVRQKIGQMTIALARNDNGPFLKKLNIGGVFMPAKKSPWSFIGNTELYQTNFTTVPLFITTDLEGCINPFETFKPFPPVKEVKTIREARELGIEHGRILNELGFNMNFAPVVDLEDKIWRCRTFTGTPEEITGKSIAYIEGLQSQGIIATSKHYPGQTLNINDPHKYKVVANITKVDLMPFYQSMNSDVGALMINHLIVSGEVDSKSKPACASPEIINELKTDYPGLIITDDIQMLGLKKHYVNEEQMYIDLFKTDNDMIIYLTRNVDSIYKMVLAVENGVMRGEISEVRLDNSVEKILKAKNITVVY
ncbi:hypothetical protein GF374_00370 [Candidatus Woesearchaeota archaeon]|nr:hypothetical protein [Candidatus Woesearchaeota archaeon]